MRDQAIDTPLPSHSPIDNLSAQETQVASLFQSKSIWLFVHLIELRRMSGRILESIYIARAQNGHCSSMSFRELCTISDELHRKLEKWKVELDSAGLEGSREYRFMKVEYFIMLLHLNRPSPSFMIPSQNMVAICSHASSSCLREWEAIAADHGIMAICRCYRQFHDILMVGLARLYCDWHIQKVAPHSVHNLSSEEATLCINLLEQGVVTLRNSSLSKFLHLFNILKSKIYSITNTAMDVDMHPTGLGDTIGTADWPSEDIQAHASNPQAGLTTHLASLDNNDAGDLRLGSDGLNAYLSQISNIFDNETLDSDEMLTAWYGSLLNDIGDSGAQPTTGL
ncbi:hypothetical protein N7456_001290 [Penicillium angulare]|uniref:Uncharacterized protein n=1 Tax=Penicillium angulare TaxID=116970 RepID=A0A9W9KRR1_9EURO|nr:hypothetical protein N7456_001290 [Penicillium angulare]